MSGQSGSSKGPTGSPAATASAPASRGGSKSSPVPSGGMPKAATRRTTTATPQGTSATTAGAPPSAPRGRLLSSSQAPVASSSGKPSRMGTAGVGAASATGRPPMTKRSAVQAARKHVDASPPAADPGANKANFSLTSSVAQAQSTRSTSRSITPPQAGPSGGGPSSRGPMIRNPSRPLRSTPSSIPSTPPSPLTSGTSTSDSLSRANTTVSGMVQTTTGSSMTPATTRVPQMPSLRPGLAMFGSDVFQDRYVVIVGGLQSDTVPPVPSAAIEVFDLELMRWCEHTENSHRALPLALYGHCCIATNSGAVWCIGGCSVLGQASRCIIQFRINFKARVGWHPMDIEIDSLTAIPQDSMLLMPAACLADTHQKSPLAIVLGGMTQDSVTVSSTEGTHQLSLTNRCFAVDLDNRSKFKVAQTGDVPLPHCSAACVAVPRQECGGGEWTIILVGGRQGEAQQTLSEAVAESGSGGKFPPVSRKLMGSVEGNAPDGENPITVHVGVLRSEGATQAFSISWRSFSPLSEAHVWPSTRFGHSLTRVGSYFLMTGQAPTRKLGGNNWWAGTGSISAGEGGNDTDDVPATIPHAVIEDAASPFLMLHDEDNGVCWSQVKVSKAAAGATMSTTLSSEMTESVNALKLDDAPFPTWMLPTARGYHSVFARPAVGSSRPTSTEPGMESGQIDRHTNLVVFGGAALTPATPIQPFVDGLISDTTFDSEARRGAGPFTEVVFRLHVAPNSSSGVARNRGSVSPGTTESSQEYPDIALLGRNLTIGVFRAELLAILRDHGIVFREAEDVLVEYRGRDGQLRPLHMEHLLRNAAAEFGGEPIPTYVRIEEPPLHYVRNTELGRGSFGTVYSALDKRSGSFFAVKEVRDIDEDRKRTTIRKEITMMRQLVHPNIVQYLGSESKGTTVYIFMEYVAGGGTLEQVARGMKMPIRQVQMYTRQLLSALEHLHGFNVVHRDIKGANVLLDAQGIVKLSDFGTAKLLTGTNHNRGRVEGTYLFMAPEAMHPNTPITTKADIWSLGCVVVQMVTGNYPYAEKRFNSEMQVLYHIGAEKNPPELPRRIGECGLDFLNHCFEPDPESRWNTKMLLRHPFITDLVPEDHAEHEESPLPSRVASQPGSFPPTPSPDSGTLRTNASMRGEPLLGTAEAGDGATTSTTGRPAKLKMKR